MKSIHTSTPVRLCFVSRQHLLLNTRRTLATAQSQAAVRDAAETPFTDPSPPKIATPPTSSRRLQDVRPFSDFLTDTFNRQHDYLRISLTERCNLRCLYCMPEEGVQLSPAPDILTTPEIEHLSRLFVSQGVTKIRLTGGEPTVRSDILPLMHKIGALRSIGLKELALTTNGISLHRKLDSMVEAGLTGVNISLDTLDPFQYQILTRRQGYNAVMKSIERVKELNRVGARIKLKVNCVVMRGLNDHQVLPFVEMTREEDVEVRFIEYMPFGGNKWSQKKMMSYDEMLSLIRTTHPGITRLKDAHTDTSKTWQVPGFVGRVGFITSMTHNFCGSCNRLRITSDGNLKVCLHGNAEVSLRDILRSNNGGEPMDEEAFAQLHSAGAHVEDQQLLDVIGRAVKRKKEKHAGIGQLENMKNRPMILIDEIATNSNTIRSISSSLHLRIEDARSTLLVPQRRQMPHWRQIPHRRAYSSVSSSEDPAFKHTTKGNDGAKPTLTHVNDEGKAQMVDVGSKASSKRVAIATACVSFSNAIPHAQIVNNTNKKGDVLGVARIAGIMAAKRTSDLIPLCHPIMITKVNVSANLTAPDTTSNPHGSIWIEARVECVGQTGVEMEALTASTAAALTIYDMCKAVDRDMVISNSKVVFKSGGKSGLHICEQWAETKDTAFLGQLGLDETEK